MTKLGAVVVAMFGALAIGGVVVVSQIPKTPGYTSGIQSASGTQSALRAQAYETPEEIALGVFWKSQHPSAKVDANTSSLHVSVKVDGVYLNDVRTFERSAAALFEVAFRPPTVERVCLMVLDDMRDVMGHELPNYLVAKVCMTRQQAYDIVWGNFLYSNLPQVAESFWVLPAWEHH